MVAYEQEQQERERQLAEIEREKERIDAEMRDAVPSPKTLAEQDAEYRLEESRRQAAVIVDGDIVHQQLSLERAEENAKNARIVADAGTNPLKERETLVDAVVQGGLEGDQNPLRAPGCDCHQAYLGSR